MRTRGKVRTGGGADWRATSAECRREGMDGAVGEVGEVRKEGEVAVGEIGEVEEGGERRMWGRVGEEGRRPR